MSSGWSDGTCEDVGVSESAAICAVCHRSPTRGDRDAAGDNMFICAQCRADAAEFIAIQDSIIEEARHFADPRRDSVDGQRRQGSQE
jgi:hypothetical protein